MEEIPKTHVAILTSPGMGHIIPIIELGKRIIKVDQHTQVTIFVPTTSSGASIAQSQLLRSLRLPEGLQILELPPADVSNLIPADAAIETRTSIVVKESIPPLRSTILAMQDRPTVLIVDIFGTDIFSMADELGMLKYVFITSTAAFTALMMHLPTLDREVVGEYTHLQEPLKVPGCKPIQIDDLIDPLLDRKIDRYTWMLHQASRYPMANGVLVNTCEELEPTSILAMRENPVLKLVPTPHVYPVGPLTSSASSTSPVSGDKCLDWLNIQPRGSVLYVSFGSGGTLSAEQIVELAWGLELSEQRFIWVSRAPTRKEKFGTYFTAGGGGGDPSDYLPLGFLDRTCRVGLVIPSWGPQIEILSHPSIGGFLTHCGWNSTLESIVHGVPMIAWPLFAEQKLNASIAVEDVGVAIRATERVKKKELVGREEIKNVVKMLLEKQEGKALRTRAKELKESVLKGLEGGSAYNFLLEVMKEWKASQQCQETMTTKEC